MSPKMRKLRAAELLGALVFVLVVLLILYPSEPKRPEGEPVRPSEDLSQSAEEEGGAAVFFSTSPAYGLQIYTMGLNARRAFSSFSMAQKAPNAVGSA